MLAIRKIQTSNVVNAVVSLTNVLIKVFRLYEPASKTQLHYFFQGFIVPFGNSTRKKDLNLCNKIGRIKKDKTTTLNAKL